MKRSNRLHAASRPPIACRFDAKGKCTRGADCPFHHAASPAESKCRPGPPVERSQSAQRNLHEHRMLLKGKGKGLSAVFSDRGDAKKQKRQQQLVFSAPRGPRSSSPVAAGRAAEGGATGRRPPRSSTTTMPGNRRMAAPPGGNLNQWEGGVEDEYTRRRGSGSGSGSGSGGGSGGGSSPDSRGFSGSGRASGGGGSSSGRLFGVLGNGSHRTSSAFPRKSAAQRRTTLEGLTTASRSNMVRLKSEIKAAMVGAFTMASETRKIHLHTLSDTFVVMLGGQLALALQWASPDQPREGVGVGAAGGVGGGTGEGVGNPSSSASSTSSTSSSSSTSPTSSTSASSSKDETWGDYATFLQSQKLGAKSAHDAALEVWKAADEGVLHPGELNDTLQRAKTEAAACLHRLEGEQWAATRVLATTKATVLLWLFMLKRVCAEWRRTQLAAAFYALRGDGCSQLASLDTPGEHYSLRRRGYNAWNTSGSGGSGEVAFGGKKTASLGRRRYVDERCVWSFCVFGLMWYG